MVSHYELDPASPQAQLAADQARALVTARLAGHDLADLIFVEDVAGLNVERAAYLIAAYSALVIDVLDCYASDVTSSGHPPITRADLFAVLVPRFAAADHTI